jgi:hypothetical protein
MEAGQQVAKAIPKLCMMIFDIQVKGDEGPEVESELDEV